MNKGQDVLEALKKATASRETFAQNHPDFLVEDNSSATTPPSTTKAHLERSNKMEKNRFKVTEKMRFDAAIKALNEGELS